MKLRLRLMQKNGTIIRDIDDFPRLGCAGILYQPVKGDTFTILGEHYSVMGNHIDLDEGVITACLVPIK